VAETRDNSPQGLAAEALQLTVAKGLGAGCQFIEAIGNPVIVASAYRAFAQALYRQNKDVQHMIDAGRRGIRFALDHAARIESDDPAAAAKLMEIAKTISLGEQGCHALPTSDRRRRPNSPRRTRTTMTRSRRRLPSPRLPSPRFPSPARAHPVLSSVTLHFACLVSSDRQMSDMIR
jgi:hypothetical protein